jgi:hypothetical protein
MKRRSDAARRWKRMAQTERLTGRQESVSLPPLRSEATWENGVEHSGSRGFADTEGVTGSNPVAPTTQSSRSDKVSVPTLRDLRRPLPHLGAHLGHARAHGCHAWALSQTPPTGSRRPDRSCRRTMRHRIAVILGRAGGSSKPQRRLGWLHRLVDHAKHVGRQRVQVNLLT